MMKANRKLGNVSCVLSIAVSTVLIVGFSTRVEAEHVALSGQTGEALPGYPKPTSAWGVPASWSTIDGGLYWPERKNVYLFHSSEYTALSGTTGVALPGYPKPISAWGVPASWSTIDGGLYWPERKNVYLFHGSEYTALNGKTGQALPGYPKPISAWGVPASWSTIDGGLYWPERGNVYLFHGSEYTALNGTTGQVLPGYPKPTSAWGLQASWTTFAGGFYWPEHETVYLLNQPTDVAAPAQTQLADGEYTVQQKSNDRYVDAHETAANDYRLVSRPAQIDATGEPDPTQRWILKKTGDAYSIQQKSNNRYLDAHETAANDYQVVTRPQQYNQYEDSQRWILTRWNLAQGGDAYTIQQKSTGRYLDAYEDADNDFRLVTKDQERVVAEPNRSISVPHPTQLWIFAPARTGEVPPKKPQNRSAFFDNNGSNKRDFYMAIMSDPQIPWRCEYCNETDKDKASEKSNAMQIKSINKLVVQVGRDKFAGIVINGDITAFGWESEFSRFNKWYTTPFEEKKIRIYPGLGNHDLWNPLNDCYLPETPERNQCTYRSIGYLARSVGNLRRSGINVSFDYSTSNNFGNAKNARNIHGSLAYSWNIGDVHFVQLNNHPAFSFNEVYGFSSGIHSFDMDIRKSFDWLEKDLKINALPGKLIVINFHDLSFPRGCVSSGFVADGYTKRTKGDKSRYYTIQQASNKRYLDAYENDDHDYGLVTRPEQPDNNTQKWVFGGHNCRHVLLSENGGTYTIRQSSNGRFVDAYEDDDYNLVTRNRQPDDYEKTQHGSQKWILKPVQNRPDTFTIQQESNDRFVDAFEDDEYNFRVVTRIEQPNDDTQHWIVKSANPKNVEMERFIAVLAPYSKQIAGIFVGHLHHRVGKEDSLIVGNDEIPIFYSGSAQYNRYLKVRFKTDPGYFTLNVCPRRFNSDLRAFEEKPCTDRKIPRAPDRYILIDGN